jgi:hypothetical protein
VVFKNKIDPVMAQGKLTAWLTRRLPSGRDVRVSDVVISTSSGMSAESVLLTARWVGDEGPEQHRLVVRVAPDPNETDMALFPTYDLELEAQIMPALRDYSPVPTVGRLYWAVLGPELLKRGGCRVVATADRLNRRIRMQHKRSVFSLLDDHVVARHVPVQGLVASALHGHTKV